MSDSRRFTLARKEKQNADIIRQQNHARIFLSSVLNEEIEQEDMGDALQDGVLLCKLINHYKPESIRRFNMNPRIPFKMMENAAYVLDFCKKNGIAINFTAEDICNKDHLILILGFILNIAERMGWAPDVTGTNESVVSTPSPSPAPTNTPPKLESTTKPSSTPSTNGRNGNGNHTTLQAIINEIIVSEKDFVADMELFFRLYLTPSKTLLPVDKIHAIFGNIENVVVANNKFLNELLMVQDGYMSIGSVWKNFASAVNIYSVYCIFQQNSYGVLEQCRREHSNFESHLKSVEYTPESKNGNVFNFLVKPFARVVKYNSVLKQLLQTVPPKTEDHDWLVEVKKEFQDLSDTTSETWKKVENSRKISEIAGNLMGAEKAGLRKLGRMYLREGDFSLNGKTVKLFLFSDIIVHAIPVKGLLKKNGGKSHIFKGTIQLNACTFQDLPDVKDGKNGFELSTEERTYKILASTAAEKRLWVADIKKFIAKLNPSSSIVGFDIDVRPNLGSTTEARPMLDLGLRRAPAPVRQNSQPNTIEVVNQEERKKILLIEERRKTVKLGMPGNKQPLDDDEDEGCETNDAASRLVVDKRKTIKLQFGSGGGVPQEEEEDEGDDGGNNPAQRQLSVRDRSPTVQLGFNEFITEFAEAEKDNEKQLIFDKRKTVKLDFQKPSPNAVRERSNTTHLSFAPTEEDAESVSEDNTETSSYLGVLEAQEEETLVIGSATEGNEEANEGNEGGKEWERENDSNSTPENQAENGHEGEENNEDNENETQENNEENGDDTHIATVQEQKNNEQNEEEVSIQDNTNNQHELLTDNAHHHEPLTDNAHHHELLTDNAHHEPLTDNAHHHEPLTDNAHHHEPHTDIHEHKHDDQPECLETEVEVESESQGSMNGTTLPDHVERPSVSTSKSADNISSSEESDNIIATLIEEIQSLKDGLRTTNEALQKTKQELDQEKEENKVWKTRAERILAVLLDAMKQNSSSARNG